MMNTQARARLRWEQNDAEQALVIVRGGIRKIARYLEESLQPLDDDDGECHEIKILRELEEQLLDDLPEDSTEKLLQELNEAIEKEEFERAAVLRDRIRNQQES